MLHRLLTLDKHVLTIPFCTRAAFSMLFLQPTAIHEAKEHSYLFITMA